MDFKEVKDRLANFVETENPPGTDYYGTELNESEVGEARERMEEGQHTNEEDDHARANHASIPGA